MDNKELKEWFEERFLKHSCFDNLDELLKDRTNVLINAPRAIIAVELKGIWKGINVLNEKMKGE